jgi:hypothetical protein
MTVIQFPKLQADTCRLHNRYFELEAQHEPEPPPQVTVTPTPLGWFLIATGYWIARMR